MWKLDYMFEINKINKKQNKTTTITITNQTKHPSNLRVIANDFSIFVKCLSFLDQVQVAFVRPSFMRRCNLDAYYSSGRPILVSFFEFFKQNSIMNIVCCNKIFYRIWTVLRFQHSRTIYKNKKINIT